MDSPELTRPVSKYSTVVAAKDQTSADLADEVVILDLKSGTYYGLDAVGSRIWSLIQEPRTVSDIRDILLEEYEVAFDRCEREILTLLQELAARRLIEVKDATDV